MEVFELQPTEIKLNKSKDQLTVAFDDEKIFEFSSEYLRVMSPSAEVQGHAPDQRKTIPGKKNVRISNIETVGHYAVTLTFDDGHWLIYVDMRFLFTLFDRSNRPIAKPQ